MPAQHIKLDQNTVNKMMRRLTNGKGKCANAQGLCVYRAPDGNSCLVGDLLTTDTMSRLMKDSPGTNGGRVATLVANGFLDQTSGEVNYLNAFQRLHDEPGHWVGNRFNLVGKVAFNLIVSQLSRLGKDLKGFDIHAKPVVR